MVSDLLRVTKSSLCLAILSFALQLSAAAQGTVSSARTPPVEIIYKASNTSFSEPRTGTTYYPVTVMVKDTSGLPASTAIEVAVETDVKSTAVKDLDYKLVAPRLLFKRGFPTAYDILVGVMADKITDTPETLVLKLKRIPNEANTPPTTLTSTLTLTLLDPGPDSRKPVYIAFATKKDTISEPKKGGVLRAVTISVKDSSSILSAGNTTVEAQVEVDEKSTAVLGQDYKWVSKPKLIFKKGNPTEYRLVLEILADAAEDNIETINLKLKQQPDSTISFPVNVASTYTITIRDGETLPDVPLSVAVGTNLNVIDKETTGANIYLDVMAFQLRATDAIPFGGYVRGYQQQGTSGFNETGLSRAAGADRLRPIYTQIATLGNNMLRVDRSYKLFTPKTPIVRSSGAVLSVGYNAINSVNATHRLQVNINAHLEWVKREIRVEYDEQTMSRDTIDLTIQQFNSAYIGMPARRYSSIDQYTGIDFPILYQCKIGEQNLGFKIIPSVGNLLIRSDYSPYSNSFYFSTYVAITEYKHGFTLGFDTKNILLNGRNNPNLGFSLFAVKMFNLSAIGNLFGFAEIK